MRLFLRTSAFWLRPIVLAEFIKRRSRDTRRNGRRTEKKVKKSHQYFSFTKVKLQYSISFQQK